VDFQAAKAATKDTRQADMALWNFVNPDKPLSAEALQAKRERDETGETLAIEEKEFGLGEKQSKASRDAESHKSDMETAGAQRRLIGANADKAGREAKEGPAPKPPRDLTDGGIKTLGEQGSKLLNVHSIVNTFKPDYTGQLAGGMSNKVGKLTGGNLVGANPDQVGWWENYQGFVNQVRNELFGAALTPGEKAEFEKTVVKPSTDPEVAKNNLLRQWEIVKGASERGASTYAAGNVNREQVGAAFGGAFDPATGKVGLGIDWAKKGPAGSPAGAPKAGDVDEGYRFKGGDPADPNNWEQI
jgi:hypothetical protein